MKCRMTFGVGTILARRGIPVGSSFFKWIADAAPVSERGGIVQAAIGAGGAEIISVVRPAEFSMMAR